MTNDEQPSPTRRSTRPKKTSEHLRGYIVGAGAKGNCGKEYHACRNLLTTFNDNAEEGSIAQETGEIAAQIAAQSAKNDMSAELNPTICDGQEQDQEQTMRGGLGQFSNDNDDELPTTHGDIEEQWTKRRKRFDKTIANEMGVDDLYEHAVLQEIEEGDSVMLEFGAEDNEDNDDGGNEGGFDGVELGSANDAHDDDNADSVTDVELGNANNTTERARKTIKPKRGVAMTSFNDIMNDEVDVEPLSLIQTTTCPKCGAEKLEAEQKRGVTKHYCCQNGSVLDVPDQPMPFQILDRTSTDPKIVAEIGLRDLLRNEQNIQHKVKYAQAQHLHQYARGFNNQFAFSSAVAKPILGTARPLFEGNYAPMVIMQGELNHFVGDMCGEHEEPQFMQLWTLDPNNAEPSRNPTDRRMQTFCSRFSKLTNTTKKLTYRLLGKIDNVMRTCNHFVREVFSISELAKEFRECDQYQFCFRPDARPAGEHERHYTNPSVDNGFITTIMDDEGEGAIDDVDEPVKKAALFIRYKNHANGRLHPVPLINEKSAALRFPLLYMRAQNDWDTHWKRVISRADQDVTDVNETGIADDENEHAQVDDPPNEESHDQEEGDTARMEEPERPHEEDEHSNDGNDHEQPYQEEGYESDAHRPVGVIRGLFGTIFSTKRMTVCDYASWHFFERDTYDNFFRRVGKLWHEWINTKYATAERQRLDFLKQNQKLLKASTYAGYVQPEDDMNEDVNRDITKQQIFIPSSFTGGKRDRYRKYQDGVAMVGKHGKPDLLITMTTNKHWPEIKALLKPNQQPDDAPEVMALLLWNPVTVLFGERSSD